MNRIPIIFATDNNYKYVLITLISISKNANSDTEYDFYFLVDDEFSLIARKDIELCVKNECIGCTIQFINIGNQFGNIHMRIDGITRPTFYRLMAPELIREDKCLYLDTDVVVLTDLCELYNTDLNEYYLAGVKAPGYQIKKCQLEYCKQAKIPDLNQYINAGVLLFNLKKMREEQVVNKFLSLLKYDMEGQDQDIINSVCYGKIYFLPFKYNVMTKYAAWPVGKYHNVVSEDELIEGWNNPKIIHYADRTKPWNNLECYLGDYWWDICKNSSAWKWFYNNLQELFYEKAIYKTRNIGFVAKKIPQLFEISYDRKYVIYGAGARARDVLDYLEEKNIVPEYIIVSQMNENPTKIKNIQVYVLDKISYDLRGKTVIIATREKFHSDIIQRLLPLNYLEIIPISDRFMLDWVNSREAIKNM